MNHARKGKRSREKGQQGERQFAKALSEHLGYDVRRDITQVRDGGTDILDVDGWAIEVRWRKQLSLGAWWKEICGREYSEPRFPALAYRQDRQPWRVIIPLDCLVDGAGDETATLSVAGFAAVLKEPYRG